MSDPSQRELVQGQELSNGSERGLNAGKQSPHPKITSNSLRTVLAGRGLFGRFGYLVATQLVTVLLGVAYWTISARAVPARAVGLAAAAVSGATLVATVGVLGISTVLLIAFSSHDRDEQYAFLTTCITMAVGAVTVLDLFGWACSSLLGPNLRRIGNTPEYAMLVLSGAILIAVTGMVDAAALGLGKSPARLLRNVLASILKIALLVIFIATGLRNTNALLLGWNLSLLLSLVVTPLMLGIVRTTKCTFARRLELVRQFWRLALGHHAVNLAIGSVTYLLPVIAAIFVIPEQVAYYSVAQLICGSALLLPYLLAMSLFVEVAGDSELLRRNIRKTFPFGLACCAAVLVVVEPAAHLLLSIFSNQYAIHGTDALRLLLLGGLPYVVKDHFVVILRSQNRLGAAAKIGLLSTTFEVLAAAVGAKFGGLDWMCSAWAIATGIEAVFFLPTVLGVLRASPDSALLMRKRADRVDVVGHAS